MMSIETTTTTTQTYQMTADVMKKLMEIAGESTDRKDEVNAQLAIFAAHAIGGYGIVDAVYTSPEPPALQREVRIRFRTWIRESIAKYNAENPEDRFEKRRIIWDGDDTFLLIANSDLRNAIQVHAGLVAINLLAGKRPYSGAIFNGDSVS